MKNNTLFERKVLIGFSGAEMRKAAPKHGIIARMPGKSEFSLIKKALTIKNTNPEILNGKAV